MAKGNNNTYQEQIKKDNKLKLRELLEQLPNFCRDFFRGIDTQTSPRTKIAYAYDLIVFFNYLQLYYTQKINMSQYVKINKEKMPSLSELTTNIK